MSRELGYAFQNMTTDMQMKLGGYMHSLEMRYGDPRVYAQQEEERLQRQAQIEFAQSKTHETALRSAYHDQREATRKAHKERLTTRGKRQQSASEPQSAQNS